MDERSISPGLLLAMPQLDDPNFERAVVLMIEHNKEGAFGLIVNRPSELRIQEATERLRSLPGTARTYKKRKQLQSEQRVLQAEIAHVKRLMG